MRRSAGRWGAVRRDAVRCGSVLASRACIVRSVRVPCFPCVHSASRACILRPLRCVAWSGGAVRCGRPPPPHPAPSLALLLLFLTLLLLRLLLLFLLFLLEQEEKGEHEEKEEEGKRRVLTSDCTTPPRHATQCRGRRTHARDAEF